MAMHAAPQWFVVQYGQPPPSEVAVLQSWFMAVDKDRSGVIDAHELQAALSSAGHKFDGDMARLLVRIFDRDGHGINFGEFQALHMFLMNIRRAFDTYDLDRNQVVNISEARGAINALGFSMIPDASFKTVMMTFDKKLSGFLDYQSFVEMASFLAYVRSLFEQYDQDKDGWVQFRLDGLITFAAMMRP